MIYRLLGFPAVYRLSQRVLAPGAAAARRRLIDRQWDDAPPGSRVLDVGCGPRSLLPDSGATRFGIDLALPYLRVFRRGGGRGTLASADRLPFAGGGFDSVWSFGLLHHLPDTVAAAAVAEMVRVCRAGGRVVIFDAVYPRRWWSRPLAHAIRRLDRGGFVRPQAAHQDLFPDRPAWTFERSTFAYTGLELVLAVRTLEASGGLG